MKKILLFTYLQRHLKKMLPIIKEFEQNRDVIELTVLLMTEEEKGIAEANGISYKMLDEYTRRQRSCDFDLAWGLEPLIKAIDLIQPDLFLCIEVNYILRNAVRYCKQTGISTMVVQHGTPNKYSLHAFTPFEADCFAAWGEFARELLVANGVEKSKIQLTGGVHFDRTLKLTPDRHQIIQELNLDSDKKLITFTTQAVGPGNCPSEEEIITGVVSVAEEMIKYGEYQLIYQVHPSQPVEYIKELVDSVENSTAVVVKYKNTEELMAASAGVITFFSTTAIDAVLMKKPLMLINLTDDRDFYPFVPMGVAFGAYDKKQIRKALADLLFRADGLEPNYARAQMYMNYMNDGRALERVMALIYKKLNIQERRGQEHG